MSKVKNYMDCNKEKARHRNRIDETRRTKANRIRKCKNGTYSFFRGGYYHETESESYRYERIFNYPTVLHKPDWDHYFKTGEMITRDVTGFYPVYKKKIEAIVKPVSILRKGLPRRAKYYKKTGNQEIRRKIIKTETWIDIDVGAGFGRQPVLLRLDDMKEFR